MGRAYHENTADWNGNVAGGLEAFVMNYYRVLVHMDIQFDFLCVCMIKLHMKRKSGKWVEGSTIFQM